MSTRSRKGCVLRPVAAWLAFPAALAIWPGMAQAQGNNVISAPRQAAEVSPGEAARLNVRISDASATVAVQDKPRTAGRKPCRKPSGERVDERIDDMEAFSDSDKR